jgi:uncharacterized protein (DUF924 family)
MPPFWYTGGEGYDALCGNFQELVRACGKNTLDPEEWQTSADGKMAQLLLCDQFSRNCFRGQDEAFAYDDSAKELARDFSRKLLSSSSNQKVPSMAGESSIPPGEIYPPYWHFIVSPLMHSESLDDHKLALDIVDFSLEQGQAHLKTVFERQKDFELQHKKVIDDFGRYPHRNVKLGRESTPEELTWLGNVDELPGWAKSQQ